jgi:hypothetical protein
VRAASVPIVAVIALVAVFAVGPVFGLPLIGRYIRTPSALLAVFYGLACFGWVSLAPSKARYRWALVGWLCLAASVVYLPRQAQMLDGLRTRRDRESTFYSDLRSLARARPVVAAFKACPHLSTADHRPIPYLRYWLGGDPGSVGTIEAHASPLGRLLLTPRRSTVAKRFYGKNFPRTRRPAGYRILFQNRSYRVYAAPGCLTRPPS